MNTVTAVVKAVAFAALTLPLMPVQQILLWTSPKAARHLPHLYHRAAARILGYTIRIEGDVPKSGAALIISNHVSWIDIVLLSAAMPVSFVAKREIGRWPFFGTLARLQHTVFVDRERKLATGETADTITARLARGEAVVLFGEGTSGDGASVMPFKSSFFATATDPNIPIHPVTLAYNRHYGLPMTRRQRPYFAWYADMEMLPHLWGAMKAGPLGVTLTFHPPLSVEDGLDRKRAARVTEATIRRGLIESLHGSRILE
jgi:lyso-ornithine lipid O-acyltransferase